MTAPTKAPSSPRAPTTPQRVAVLFGTRPEIIKLAPVIRSLAARPDAFDVRVISSGQHTDLLARFLTDLKIDVDVDLTAGRPGQTPVDLCARVLTGLGAQFANTETDAVLVQGDTTTALAGALAAFNHGITVGHVEAGLRSGNRTSPFPEEMNRRLIGELADVHFAATERNAVTLRNEGVAADTIFRTGNPVVDSLFWTLENLAPAPSTKALIDDVGDRRLILATMHRRESFGPRLLERLSILRDFLARTPDTELVIPVHPNPNVLGPVTKALGSDPRIRLIDPVGYADFLHLLKKAWLVVSDSGGVQEEAPSLGKPVLVIRENTERPEAVEAGVARVVGESAEAFANALEECAGGGAWIERVAAVENPFGTVGAGDRIATALSEFLAR